MFQALSRKIFHVLSTKKKRYDLDVIETVLQMRKLRHKRLTDLPGATR